MITFVYGPSGSGKSAYVLSALQKCAAAGKTAYLLVPEQQAVLREDELARILPPSAQRSLEVLNFTRAANRVFRRFGGLCYNYVTAGARSLLMWDALRSSAPYLQKYAQSVSTQRGVAQTVDLMLTAVRQCKMYGVSAAQLESAAGELAGEEIENGAAPGKLTSLPGRLRDLSLVYAAYDELLHSRWDDPDDDLDALANTLGQNDFFGGSEVFVDAFYSYTPAEYAVLRQIFAQADNVTVTFCMPYKSKRAEFAHIKAASDILARLAAESGAETEKIELNGDVRHNNPALAYLSANVWNFTAKPFDGSGAPIDVVRCRDPYEQASYAAAAVEKLAQNGVKYGDIAVIIRGGGSFEGILDAEFERQGIPYYFSKRTGLSRHPASALLTRALAAVADNYRREDVVAYIKTGMVPLGFTDGTTDADATDTFAAYVSMWGITGSRMKPGVRWEMNPDGYTDVLTEEGAATIGTVNRVRDTALGFLSVFEAQGRDATVADWCRAAYEFLLACGVSERLKRQSADARAAGNLDEAMQSDQIWHSLTDCLDTAVSVLGQTKTDADGFEAMLRLLFSTADVGTIPTGTNEVLIGDAATLRVKEPRYALLLGVNEGVFPMAESGGTDFFSDTDIVRLEGAGVSIGENARSPADLRAGCEFFFSARAVAVPSEGLALAYTDFDSAGAEAKPSQLIARVLKLMPEARTDIYSSLAPWDKIFTPRQAADYLYAHGGSDGATAAASVLKAALDGFMPEEEIQRAFVPDDALRITGEDAASVMFGRRINMSASRLEAFASCPFAFWCRYGAKLGFSDKRRDFKAADVGNFIHSILETLVSRLLLPDGTLRSPDDSELDGMCDAAISDYVSVIFKGVSSNSNRLMFLVGRLRRCVRLFARSICDEFSASKFSPRYFELPIGSRDKLSPPPLQFIMPDGTQISLYGTIDRVDTVKRDGVTYIRVTDYKTGQASFRAENIAAGLNLQLLLYLFTLWKCPRGEFRDDLTDGGGEIQPSGMLYFLVNPPEVTVAPGTVDTEAAAADSLKRKGLVIDRVDILEAMEENLAGRFIPVKLKKDGAFTAASSICSIDRFGEMYNEVANAVCAIGKELRSGYSAPEPADLDRCAYCDFKPVCRSARKK